MKDNEIFEVFVTIIVTSFVTFLVLFTPNTLPFKQKSVIFFLYSNFDFLKGKQA